MVLLIANQEKYKNRIKLIIFRKIFLQILLKMDEIIVRRQMSLNIRKVVLDEKHL